MLANLRALFGVIVDIVLLRRGPENLPASLPLLVITVVLYAVVASFVASAVAPPEENWPLSIGTVIGVTVLWYHVALRVAGKRERFLQTLTAMFAVQILFAPLRMPVVSALMVQAQAYEENKIPPSTGLTLLAMFIMLWQFIVTVRIIRAAFDWPWFPAVVLALAQEFAMLLVLAALLGGAAPST
jgi:hypothetical protein